MTGFFVIQFSIETRLEWFSVFLCLVHRKFRPPKSSFTLQGKRFYHKKLSHTKEAKCQKVLNKDSLNSLFCENNFSLFWAYHVRGWKLDCEDVIVVMTILPNGLEQVSNFGSRLGPTIGIRLTRMDPTIDVFQVLRKNVFSPRNLKLFH
jgi:hypothetical protein